MMREIVVQAPEGFARIERHSPGSHVAGLRVYVHKEHRRKGVATQLIRMALLDAAREGVRRVEATPYCDNDASTQLFRDMPEFRFECIKRGGGMREGKLVDTRLYASLYTVREAGWS